MVILQTIQGNTVCVICIAAQVFFIMLLRSETGVVLDLLKAQQLLAAWQFLPAMLSVQSAYQKLANWAGLVPPTVQV